MTTSPNWSQFQSHQTGIRSLGLSLDTSRMACPPDTLRELAPRFEQAFADMARLEQGAIANPDENRMVGHYWLRTPELAPQPELTREITQSVAAIREFAAAVVASGEVVVSGLAAGIDSEAHLAAPGAGRGEFHAPPLFHAG